nr:hypothetical protein [Escherichia coli]
MRHILSILPEWPSKRNHNC